ncbi:MAG: hypothetical protein ACKV2T_06370 [Kofleriaceae bacterium]
MTIVFSSFEPKLLRVLIELTPTATPTIPLSIVEVHDQWLNDAQYEGIRSSGVELVLWMFSATVETFDAIERYEPYAVVTSEAQLMRRWLDN